MINAGLIEIYTGEPDWDTTFMLAQKEAFSLFMGPTSSLPYSSYVQNRQIDQGYSLRGDGSDYSHLWNGQSPIESYYLTKMILPMAPDLAQGLIYNFLSVQEDDGFIDWKPGLGGQRSRLLATPLLASLAWYVYESSEDREFLEKIYAGLKKFFHKWLAPENDRDGDGIPEWGHPLQLGAEDHPVYSYWHDDSQGIDITTIESTALNTWLYQECQSLIKIATVLRDMESVAEFRSFGHRFKEAVEDSWDEDAGAYQNRDRDSHQSADTALLAQNSGAGIILIQHTFEVPVRLLIHLNTSRGTKPHPQIFVHGTSVSGLHRVEKITVDQFRWFSGKGVMTAQNVYTEIEQIDVQGLEAGDEIAIYTAGSSWLDYTSLLPLWAGIPSAEQAQIMIENCITNPERFWHPYGLTSCPHFHEANATAFCSDIQPIWNQFLGEGLVVFGYRELAAELVTRLMNAMIANLKEEGAFQRFYNADTGKGVGDRNVLGGLPPLGLFMETLGVRLISAHKVMLEGFNPFPWPVTIKYRGLTIVRQREKTIVVFPDGQTVNIDDTKQRVVSLE